MTASRTSPDSSLICSDETGRPEIWVRPYPGPGRAQLVSNEGGRSPLWSRDGKEIFFLSKGKLMSVSVRAGVDLTADPPRELFTLPNDIDWHWRFYGVIADGSRFIMVRMDPLELRPLDLVIVPNWIAELETRMAQTGSN